MIERTGFALANPFRYNPQPHERTFEAAAGLVLALAQKLYEIQMSDSRIGFEASNQYYYVPMDLAETVLNCRDLLTRWRPAQQMKWQL